MPKQEQRFSMADLTDLASLVSFVNLSKLNQSNTTTPFMDSFNIQDLLFSSKLPSSSPLPNERTKPFDIFSYGPLRTDSTTTTSPVNYPDLASLNNLAGLFNNIGSNTLSTSTSSAIINLGDLIGLIPGISGTRSTSSMTLGPTSTPSFNLGDLSALIPGLNVGETTTSSSGFDLGDLSGLIGGNSAGSDAFNPMSILGLLGGGGGGSAGSGTGSSSLNALSILNLLGGGGGSSLGSLTSILPLLGSLDSKTSLGLLSSLPQINNLIQSFSTFKFPTTDGKNPVQILNEWTVFVGDLRAQTINIVQILTNIGQIKPGDSKIIQAILAANIETITNPDVIGK
jgi:hypothetical protein